MTDGTRTDGSAGAGRPGEVVLSSAMAEVRQWAADPDTDAAPVGTPKAASEMGRTALPGTAPSSDAGAPGLPPVRHGNPTDPSRDQHRPRVDRSVLRVTKS